MTLSRLHVLCASTRCPCTDWRLACLKPAANNSLLVVRARSLGCDDVQPLNVLSMQRTGRPAASTPVVVLLLTNRVCKGIRSVPSSLWSGCHDLRVSPQQQSTAGMMEIRRIRHGQQTKLVNTRAVPKSFTASVEMPVRQLEERQPHRSRALLGAGRDDAKGVFATDFAARDTSEREHVSPVLAVCPWSRRVQPALWTSRRSGDVATNPPGPVVDPPL